MGVPAGMGGTTCQYLGSRVPFMMLTVYDRERLAGNWGIVDVQDMLTAATALSAGAHPRVDAKRLCIRGVSAGGFTVLSTLCDTHRRDLFAAATSMYGISELVTVRLPACSCTRSDAELFDAADGRYA
jgi:poly(3-hydroxybutyrate) depolymerase